MNSGSNVAKNFVRVLCLVILVMFFLPSFAVSCSDEQIVELSMKDMAFGRKITYENKDLGISSQVREVEPHTMCIALVAVPIVIIVISLFLENMRALGAISILAAASNIVVTILTKNEILKKIDETTKSEFLEQVTQVKVLLGMKYPYYTILVASGLIVAFALIMVFNSDSGGYYDYNDGYYDGYDDGYYNNY